MSHPCEHCYGSKGFSIDKDTGRVTKSCSDDCWRYPDRDMREVFLDGIEKEFVDNGCPVPWGEDAENRQKKYKQMTGFMKAFGNALTIEKDKAIAEVLDV